MTNVQKGDKGTAVEFVQMFLRSSGFIGKNGKPLDIDGEFGTNTEYAVQRYKMTLKAYGYGVNVNGIFDTDCYKYALGL